MTRISRRMGFGLFVLSLCAAAGPASFSRAQGANPTRIADVIYGRKDGVSLTLDVLKPAKQSGVGVLFMVSGGWVSNYASLQSNATNNRMKAFLDRGQTVFLVLHGTQPRYTIPEITHDIDRAVRFVRYHAKEYGVDPDRLAISGISSGGHLSLMQGVRGAAGTPLAKDPVYQMSSKVQAVACFFPPTDFLNYGKPGENAYTGETLKNFRGAFGIRTTVLSEIEALARDASPITFVSKETPPTLIIHGDADLLVPFQQAQTFMKKLEENGVQHKLVVRPGKAHGWPMMDEDMALLAAWIEQYARGTSN